MKSSLMLLLLIISFGCIKQQVNKKENITSSNLTLPTGESDANDLLVQSENAAPINNIVTQQVSNSPDKADVVQTSTKTESNWGIVQKNSDDPLIVTNSNFEDDLYGVSKYIFENTSKSSHLKIYEGQSYYVYELYSKGGYLQDSLVPELSLHNKKLNLITNDLSRPLSLSLNLRIPEVAFDNSNNFPEVNWALFSSINLTYNDPRTMKLQKLELRILHGSSNPNENFKNLKIDKNQAVIWQGYITDNQKSLISDQSLQVQSLKYDVTKYLCNAVKQSYQNTDNSLYYFPANARNPKNWKIDSYDLKLQTSSGTCTAGGSYDKNGIWSGCSGKLALGSVAITAQASKISLKMDTKKILQNICETTPDEEISATFYLNNLPAPQKIKLQAKDTFSLSYISKGTDSCGVNIYADGLLIPNNGVTKFPSSYDWGRIKLKSPAVYKYQIDCSNSQNPNALASATFEVDILSTDESIQASQNGVCGTTKNQPPFSGEPSISIRCATGTPTSVVEANNTYSWTCLGIQGGTFAATNASCSAPKKVNASCGPKKGQTLHSAPTSQLCSSGFASIVSTANNSYSWSCEGVNGGSNISCSAIKAIDAVCGSSKEQSLRSAPTSQLCSTGKASVVATANNLYTWNCLGANGGYNISCSANKTIDAVCGASRGQTLNSAPTSQLCSTGYASVASLSGNSYVWSCTGVSGGSNATCSATKATAPVVLPTPPISNPVPYSSTKLEFYYNDTLAGSSVSVKNGEIFNLKFKGTNIDSCIYSQKPGGFDTVVNSLKSIDINFGYLTSNNMSNNTWQVTCTDLNGNASIGSITIQVTN